ncbi:phosphatidylethanolamine N-methyltransferase [Luminiphilus syltensis NOR5-1B]|uniref:Phosphatidylethanolamine N-methyltransferase n=2 Tax=Luminiphilus TaxID=1341118 RepID=B8KR28_9GAMM|nr:phosphatidylethanolamine N-methyltransferase [Luminiphilus syltensis NOR5-1B]
MAKWIEQISPKSLLEVGVGTGLALSLYPEKTTVVGIDISFDMLTRAKAQLRETSGEQVKLILADAENLPLPDNHFDCVTAPYVLSVTPDPSALMHEMRRVCKPNGKIIIVNHFKGAGIWSFAEQVVSPLSNYIGFQSNFSIENLDSKHWEIEKIQNVNLLSLSKLVLLNNATS